MPPKTNLGSLAGAVSEAESDIKVIRENMNALADTVVNVESNHANLLAEISKLNSKTDGLVDVINNTVKPALEQIPILAQRVHESSESQARFDAMIAEVRKKQDENKAAFAKLNSQPVRGDEAAVTVFAEKAVNEMAEKVVATAIPEVEAIKKRVANIEKVTQDELKKSAMSDKSKLIIRGVNHGGNPFDGLISFLPQALVDDIWQATVKCNKLIPPGDTNPDKAPLCFEFRNPAIKHAVRRDIRNFLKTADRSLIPKRLALDDYTPKALIPERKRVLELGAALRTRLGGFGGPIRQIKAVIVNDKIVLQVRANKDIEAMNSNQNRDKWAQIPAGLIDGITEFAQISFPTRSTKETGVTHDGPSVPEGGADRARGGGGFDGVAVAGVAGVAGVVTSVAPTTPHVTSGQLPYNPNNMDTSTSVNSLVPANHNPNTDKNPEMTSEVEMMSSLEGNSDQINGNNKRMSRQISANSKPTYERRGKMKMTRREDPHRRVSEDLAIDHTLMMERTADDSLPASNKNKETLATLVASSTSAPVDPSTAADVTSGASQPSGVTVQGGLGDRGCQGGQGDQGSGESTQKEDTLLGAEAVSTTPASL